jgi:hypothetical protein
MPETQGGAAPITAPTATEPALVTPPEQVAPQPPAVVTVSSLSGRVLFRGEPVADAEVKLVDALTGQPIAVGPTRTDANGAFALNVPVQTAWVRLLATRGPSTLTALVDVQGAARTTLAATDLQVSEVSTALAQLGMGVFLLSAHLPAGEAEAARQDFLRQMTRFAPELARAFVKDPNLVNHMAADADPATGLPKTAGPVEQVAAAAGALESFKQASREALQQAVKALAAPGGQKPALNDSKSIYLGPALSGTVDGGHLRVTGARGLTIALTPGGAALGEALAAIQNPTFFTPSRSRNRAQVREPLTLVGFSPAQGHFGSTVTITGTGFDAATPANNLVKFNGVTATVTAATSTTLTVTVPTATYPVVATAGLISVAVQGASPGEPVLSEQPFRAGSWSQLGTTYYDSLFHSGPTAGRMGDVFNGEGWTNGRGELATIYHPLSAAQTVSEITIGEAASDLGGCTDIYVELLKPDGEWVVVDHVEGGNLLNYSKVLAEPVEAIAFQLRMYGPGWFWATDVQLQAD